MDFVTSLSVFTNWNDETYNSISIIVDWLIKIVYYEPVKVTIDNSGLAEIIIKMVLQNHNLSDIIVTNQSSVFISKFLFSLC